MVAETCEKRDTFGVGPLGRPDTKCPFPTAARRPTHAQDKGDDSGGMIFEDTILVRVRQFC